MSAVLRVVPAEYHHIAPVAIHMRQSDRDEVAASSGKSPFEALEYSMARSTMAHTVLFDDVPAGIFGCGDLNILSRKGSPWFLGTDLVDDRNAVSIRWLRWLGFTLSEPMPVGRGGLPFRLFELRR